MESSWERTDGKRQGLPGYPTFARDDSMAAFLMNASSGLERTQDRNRTVNWGMVTGWWIQDGIISWEMRNGQDRQGGCFFPYPETDRIGSSRVVLSSRCKYMIAQAE